MSNAQGYRHGLGALPPGKALSLKRNEYDIVTGL